MITKLLRPRCLLLDDGSLFLWKELDYNQDTLNFKHMLFGWHTASFYGTTLELREINGVEGIVLPPVMAMQYLSDVTPVQTAVIQWSEEFQLLRRYASLLRQALIHGWYIPDLDRWNDGLFGWKLALPDTLKRSAEFIYTEAASMQLGPIERWLDFIIRELVDTELPLADGWQQLQEEYPMLSALDEAHKLPAEHRADVNRSEEDWLIAIGLREDPLPFRTGLRLTEPHEEERLWTLEPVLQDKLNLDTFIPIVVTPTTADAAANTKFFMPDIGFDIPADWQPHVQERISKDLTLWAQQLPELAANDNEELDAASVSIQDRDAQTEGSTSSAQAIPLLRSKLTSNEAWKFLSEYSQRLLAEGSAVFLPSWWESLKRSKLKMKAKLKSSVGSTGSSMLGIQQLMEFDWKFSVGDLSLSEQELEELAKQQQRLVRFQDRWIELDPDTLARIQTVMSKMRKKRGLSFKDVLEMVLRDGDSFQLEDESVRSEEDYLRFEVELNDSMHEMMMKLQSKKGLPLVSTPDNFKGSLRSYQTDGVSWLLFLRQCGLGGCLADDMGLGKTIQFINYLLVLHNQRTELQPSLLICPTSVLGNWQKELERFAPDLNVHIHYGATRTHGEHFLQTIEGMDLVLTSYTTAQMDEQDLSQLTWSCICLDEAQFVKNVYTKQSAAVRKLDAMHRIALTGTPIENRLTELWSIFDFINPGYLGTLNDFRQRYVIPIERDRDEQAIQEVQRLIHPFLLRRVKKDPAIQLDLPDKNEMKEYVPLTVEQGTLYESIIQDMLDRVDRLAPMERRGYILSTLTKLKQVCDLPDLLLKGQSPEPWVTRSNKVDRLLDMIEELRAEGDRCLVFTQFIGMGEWLQKVISQRTGERVLFLHGGVPKKKRDDMISEFQDTAAENSPTVFILSLKAGGIGLNLTAANHVFHFDRWWNPAVENQATDRAFRIGQTRDVQVHKFITLGTLEERIDEMLELKQGLSDSIVAGGENWITEMSTDELRELFALRRSWAQEE